MTDLQPIQIDRMPTKHQMEQLMAAGVFQKPDYPENQLMFGLNRHVRTDQNDNDQSQKSILDYYFSNGAQPTDDEHIHALLQRGKSVLDLTEKLYDELNHNPNSFENWYPPLLHGIQQQDFFKTPRSQFMQLPLGLSQFLRIEYFQTNQVSNDAFNQFVFNAFNLEDDKTYFIKTGTFSSKFEFRNAKCNEPREMGDYFRMIQNNAMVLGAGGTNTIVVREYIEDPENNPTIYNGMPLRTEFRAFYDFDTHTLIGITPYWHPQVMQRTLDLQGEKYPNLAHDALVYKKHEPKLTQEFNDYAPLVEEKLKGLLKDVHLSGQYSVDVMKSGDDFYVIDMALMQESALVELLKVLPEKCYVSPNTLDNYMIYGSKDPQEKTFIHRHNERVYQTYYQED